jgi:hypothetical protein
MIIHLFTALALAVCPQRSSPEMLDTVIQLAERSFQELNPEGFESATSAAHDVLDCVNKPLSPSLAARFHRLRGFEWFSVGEQATHVLEAFRASAIIDPAYTLPYTLVPAQHPLRHAYNAASSSLRDPRISILMPQTGSLVVDGTPNQDVPSTRPYVFQIVNNEGKATSTSHVATGNLPPAYAIAEKKPARTKPLRSAPVTSATPHTSRTLAISSGVAALVGTVLYAVAAGHSKQFHDIETDYGELSALKRQTNSLAVLSGALGGAAVGTGLSALVVGNW